MEAYLLKVIEAISAISVPVGPQGSLLVAVQCQSMVDSDGGARRGQGTTKRPQPPDANKSGENRRTISDLHLYRRITLGDIFDAAHNLGHIDDAERTPSTSRRRGMVKRCESEPNLLFIWEPRNPFAFRGGWEIEDPRSKEADSRRKVNERSRKGERAKREKERDLLIAGRDGSGVCKPRPPTIQKMRTFRWPGTRDRRSERTNE